MRLNGWHTGWSGGRIYRRRRHTWSNKWHHGVEQRHGSRNSARCKGCGTSSWRCRRRWRRRILRQLEHRHSSIKQRVRNAMGRVPIAVLTSWRQRRRRRRRLQWQNSWRRGHWWLTRWTLLSRLTPLTSNIIGSTGLSWRKMTIYEDIVPYGYVSRIP